MDMDSITYFLVLKKYENMAVAADILNISQPALSRKLSVLESELGVQLFDRIGRRIRLNSNGEIFSKYAEQAMNLLDVAQLSLQNKRNISNGKLNILYHVHSSIVTHCCNAYRIQNPEASFMLFMSDHIKLGEKDEVHDFIFRSLNTKSILERNNYWIPQELFQEEWYLVSSDSYRPIDWDSVDGPLDIRSCKNAHFITAAYKNFYFQDLTVQLCREAGFFPEVYCQISDFFSKMVCVSEGQGVALLPESCLNDAKLIVPDLRFFVLKNSPKRSILLMHPPKAQMSKIALDFYNFTLDFYNVPNNKRI